MSDRERNDLHFDEDLPGGVRQLAQDAGGRQLDGACCGARGAHTAHGVAGVAQAVGNRNAVDRGVVPRRGIDNG